jgi:hypothetical protein
MAYLFVLSIGALLGGLFFCFKNLFPYLGAARSGVIVRQGARGIRVRRDEDPEGFSRLLANRRRGAMLGLALSFAGVCVLASYALAIAGIGAPLSLLYFVASLAFSGFALYCLIRGFATGDMYAFWGLAMQGGAQRKQNPTWFWIYTLANILVVINGAFALLRLLLVLGALAAH